MFHCDTIALNESYCRISGYYRVAVAMFPASYAARNHLDELNGDYYILYPPHIIVTSSNSRLYSICLYEISYCISIIFCNLVVSELRYNSFLAEVVVLQPQLMIKLSHHFSMSSVTRSLYGETFHCVEYTRRTKTMAEAECFVCFSELWSIIDKNINQKHCLRWCFVWWKVFHEFVGKVCTVCLLSFFTLCKV